MTTRAAPYATLADLRLAVGVGDGSQDVLLELALGAATEAIRSACGRNFAPPTGVSESRYFELSSYNPPTVDIDDLADPTGLVLHLDDGTGTFPTLVSTVYDMRPVNALTRFYPYTQIAFRTFMVVPAWSLAGPRVKVTSDKWGWPATPSAVREACLIQATRFFKRKDSPFGIAGSSAEGNILRLLARLDPDVQHMLTGFERYAGFVA